MFIHWSDLSPDSGHPQCLCSLCAKPIAEDELPMRVFRRTTLEARFHPSCFSEAWPELERQRNVDNGVFDAAEIAETIVTRFMNEAHMYSLPQRALTRIIVETLEGREPEPHVPGDDDLDLGQCCACRTTENVRNIIAIPKRAPIPGTGWGCLQCDLDMNGAVAVLCDDCLQGEAKILEVCFGYPKENSRVSIDVLSDVTFDHDPTRHPESFPGK